MPEKKKYSYAKRKYPEIRTRTNEQFRDTVGNVSYHLNMTISGFTKMALLNEIAKHPERYKEPPL